MFRYKGSRDSGGISEERSKITRLSSSDSCSSKDGVDPGKDSWVFSKDGSRKHSSNRRRSVDHGDDETPRKHSSNRRRSVDHGDDETPRKHSSYRRRSIDHSDDMSYTIREERNTPPIEADENMKVNVFYRGMVYRIRGIKIICSIISGIILLLAAVVILGVWIILGASDDGRFYFPWSQRPDTNDTIKPFIQNITEYSEYIVSMKPNVTLPPEITFEEDISFKIPSAEVGEALGHLKAVHPRPKLTSVSPLPPEITPKDYNDAYNDYYDDYVEYYEDSIDEYSLLRPVVVEPPPGFKLNIEDYGRDQRAEDFRVHIGGEDDLSDRNQKQHNRQESRKSFRPSPRIPEYAPSPRIIESDESRKFSSTEKTTPSIEIKDKKFTNSHTSVPTKVPNKESVVEYDGVLIESNSEDLVTYYDEYSDYLLDPTPKPKDIIKVQTQFPKQIKITEITEPVILPPSDKHFIEEVVVEPDPHRKLFIGNYGSEEIILDGYDPEMPLFDNSFPARKSHADPFNIANSGRIPVYQPGRNSQVSRAVFSGYPYPSSRRQQVPGTVHPIPHVRRSHISAGFRPRLNKANMDFLRMRARQSHNVDNNAAQFVDQIVAQSIPPASTIPRRNVLPRHMINHHMNMNRRIDGPLPQRSAGARRIVPFRFNRAQLQQNAVPTPASSRLPPGIFPGQQLRLLPAEIQRPLPAEIQRPFLAEIQRPLLADIQRPLPAEIQRPLPAGKQRPLQSKKQTRGGFMNALQSMYGYSKRIASSLLKFPQMNDVAKTNATTDFLKNSFGLLDNYQHVFSNLPQVFMEPLIKFQLPSVEQMEKLNPFQLSLITWTFIDFWEFLIEKVGTLTREDLQVLELRLVKIRQSKDSSIARALISTIPRSGNQELVTAMESLKLSLLNDDDSNEITSSEEMPPGIDDVIEINSKTEDVDVTESNTEIPDEAIEQNTETTEETTEQITEIPEEVTTESNTGNEDEVTEDNFEDPEEEDEFEFKSTGKQIMNKWIMMTPSEEQSEFMQYVITTLFNFGKVYLKNDYALDCMMLLFCKDINSNTKRGGMDGVAARLKSVGLKVLTDKEGRERDTINSVWQALTRWQPLECDVMFPKCDGSKALEIVNEVANASR